MEPNWPLASVGFVEAKLILANVTLSSERCGTIAPVCQSEVSLDSRYSDSMLIVT